ncbi:hypothetical protein [Flavihumibacter sp. CACIAM 22H1]|uniref:hypothetical protein n=1 Tax=Flavihumibacter sp. CACIAM 22H1 TaxID=1812911 RepID=UPI0007A913A3|nr:hypothetical protein [Flavihumibacter sp. CACIAM 22H1]KYP15345.1 MAG: hypothetical protein A1D16_15710 [Flavihumibacter sp. CACIAM 22H1]
MVLSIQPFHKEREHPLSGFLIEGPSPVQWLILLQSAGFNLETTKVYPVPGTTANSSWGCFVLPEKPVIPEFLCTPCQFAHSKIHLPFHATIYPTLTNKELSTIFSSNAYLFHPRSGLIELESPINWKEEIDLPELLQITFTIPAKTIFKPGKLKSILIEESNEAHILQQLENSFPNYESLEVKPLGIFERVKLYLLRFFLKGSFSQSINPKWSDQLKLQLNQLEDRNNKGINKLIDLLKKDPLNGLKYAIPIKEQATSRGSAIPGEFKLAKIWSSLSLNQPTTPTGSAFVSVSGTLDTQLYRSYIETAKNLQEQGHHDKAAFIYLKLLNQPLNAANTLYAGNFFKEAAVLFEKNGYHQKAAESFEQATMLRQALHHYIKCNMMEKAGDLYTVLEEPNAAAECYKKHINGLLASKNRIKAASIYRTKLNEEQQASAILLEGWQINEDPVSCLLQFLHYFEAPAERLHKLTELFESLEPNKAANFVKVLLQEQKRNATYKEEIRLLLFQLISKMANSDPAFVEHLRLVNKNDQRLLRDITSYIYSRNSNNS